MVDEFDIHDKSVMDASHYPGHRKVAKDNRSKGDTDVQHEPDTDGIWLFSALPTSDVYG